MANLKDQVVVITGAGSGIGMQTALRFAGEGARVAVADRDAERVRALAQRIEEDGGQALAITADVSQRDDVRRMVRAAEERFGRIDVLVSSAGYALGATIEDTTAQDFRELWETNVMGMLWGMQEVLPIMRRQRAGHIINISSAAGRIAYPGIGAYSATKHAIVALTDAVRAEEAEAGIQASVVYPIGTRTKFFEAARLVNGASVGPHGPTQSPEHVAKRIVACAKRPTLEVLPYRPLRLGIMLNSIVPALMAFIRRRAHRTQRGSEPQLDAQQNAPLTPREEEARNG